MHISVLVVEDDPVIRDDVRKLLEGAGYVVRCASGVDEALHVLTTLARPCILLWDAMTCGGDLTLLDLATREGVHVTTLPVTVASMNRDATRARRPLKTLVCKEAILRIVEEHCPREAARPV
jgi:CheY-like chemotaxis protein